MKEIYHVLQTSTDTSFTIKQEQGSQFAAPYHYHQGYEITLIVKGRGKFFGGNKIMNFSEGDIYLFGHGFAHLFVNEKAFVKSGELAHSIIIQFEKDFLGADFFKKPELRKIKELLRLSDRGIKLAKPANKVSSLLFKLSKHRGIEALILLLQLLNNFSKLKNNEITYISPVPIEQFFYKSDFKKLEPVYQYVLENFKEEVNTKKAASLAFMNIAAFCRYFKRRTKKTFSQFVNHVRITHAIYLLSEKDLSVANICFECGFNNFSYFNRQFKLITEKTPLEYRKVLLQTL